MNKTIEKTIKENKEDKPNFEDIYHDLVDAYVDNGGVPLDLSDGTDDRVFFENMAYIIWENGLTKWLIDHVWSKTWFNNHFEKTE